MDTLETQEIQDDVPLQKEKKVREKKPRREKQLAHFANMAAKRKENIEKKKLEKKIESAKLLIENDIQVGGSDPLTPDRKRNCAAPKKEIRKQLKGDAIFGKGDPKEEPPSEEEESESEEEIIVKTRKSKPKKKAKKVIIVQESESEEESEEEEIQAPKRRLKTQQNKKSIVKVYQQEPTHRQTASSQNYFCD